MTVAEQLRREARDYRTRGIAAGDQGEDESETAFSLTALVLYEVARAIDEGPGLEDIDQRLRAA